MVYLPWVVHARRAGRERPYMELFEVFPDAGVGELKSPGRSSSIAWERPPYGVLRRAPRQGVRELKSPGRRLSIAWGWRPPGWGQGGRVLVLAPRGTPRGHCGSVGTYGLLGPRTLMRCTPPRVDTVRVVQPGQNKLVLDRIFLSIVLLLSCSCFRIGSAICYRCIRSVKIVVPRVFRGALSGKYVLI